MSLIIKAAQFAANAHKDQLRKYNNRPYIEHPARVAGKVSIQPWATDELVAIAWLHDVLEDCDITCSELDNKFGKDVASGVWWLTNPSKGLKGIRAERKKLDRHHIKQAPLHIKLIKIIDRIDNLNDMKDSNDNEFFKLYLKESELLVDAININWEPLVSELNLVIDEGWLSFSRSRA